MSKFYWNKHSEVGKCTSSRFPMLRMIQSGKTPKILPYFNQKVSKDASSSRAGETGRAQSAARNVSRSPLLWCYNSDKGLTPATVQACGPSRQSQGGMKCWSHQNSVSAQLAFSILHSLGSSYLEMVPPTVKRGLLTSTNLFKITHHMYTQRPDRQVGIFLNSILWLLL